MRPGLSWSPDRSRARVWAPRAATVELRLVDGDRLVPLQRRPGGWHEADVEGVAPGDRYFLRLDGKTDRPDPASLSQPDGVHGPSRVVDLTYDWTDTGWLDPPLHDHVLYEIHVGTFSPAGTFAGVVERLGHLTELGVTAIELMPVAQFPGERNWGYDGVDLFAVQHSYGGARELQRLVDASHRAGLAVFLDVVYNHLGPEGNYLSEFGPYFTDRYRTPWGEAVNLDGPGSDHVRDFFIENALMWVDDFHVDGLRLDAVHAMHDQSARPFLRRLAGAVHRRAEALGRRVQVVAENAANDPRVVRSSQLGGLGLDGAWNDDFHHALHVALTGETTRYYADFTDPVADLATALDAGYVNAGRYSPYRDRRHGAPSGDLPRSALTVFAQNHDQVGNRACGDRLSTLVDPPRLRFAAAVTLLSPWVPLLFMGEEWAETRPFLYFVDHGDPELVESVRRGRAREFAGFISPDATVPDPADPGTFAASTLDWDHRDPPMRALYRELIRVRSEHRALRDPDPAAHRVERDGQVITLTAEADDERIISHLNAGDGRETARLPAGRWELVLDGADRRFGGPGSPRPGRVTGDDPLGLDGWDFIVHREVA